MKITNFLFVVSLLILISINNINAQKLVNANATEKTKLLKKFLDETYKKKIISGQAFEKLDENWNNIISAASGGKLPAMIGLDFMNSTPDRIAKGSNPNAATDMAIDWVKNKGGIVEMHWHWDAPKNVTGDWWQAFYTKNTTFDLSYAMRDTSSEDYKLLIRDIDLIAAQLLRLQDADVPILWRPLHEAEGKWFWWGAKGGAACKSLWNVVYSRLTYKHKLNNLIWVWNSYGLSKENWYPGDTTVDIIAYDYEASNSWSDYQYLFSQKDKPFALGEEGTLPDPANFSKRPWLYFLTWAYMIKDKNSTDWINKVYNNPLVITLDDLNPGPKSYPGPSQTVFDADNDGFESVKLDGSASKTDVGTITNYSWIENEVEIASGVSATINLPVGVHKITLKVTTSENQVKSNQTIITVKPISLSFKKAVTASSTEANFGNVLSNINDGLESTRWSSLYADPQWVRIDLGKVYNIEKVVLNWEVASAKKYAIEESLDGINWTTVIEKSNLNVGARIDTIKNMQGGARYIRMYGLQRNTTYGYSLYEFEVYGSENSLATPVGTPSIYEKNTSLFNYTKLNIYPTLLSNNEILTIDNIAGDEDVSIYNSFGKLIFVSKNTKKIVIDSKYTPGLYIIDCKSKTTCLTSKFIVR